MAEPLLTVEAQTVNKAIESIAQLVPSEIERETQHVN